MLADGCGGMIDCGSCAGNQVCGASAPNVCGGTISNCTPQTCEEAQANCGFVTDGCGGLLDCGTCTQAGESCGGGGVHNRCGTSGGGNPNNCPALRTCADVGAECGLISNGCGGVVDCGACTAPGESCGGGGVHNACGQATCAPVTCAGIDPMHCGPVSDGCGGLLTGCGTTCVSPQACGAGGVRDRCGEPVLTCAPLDQTTVCAGRCGPASDGCGGSYDCGGCGAGQTCGGGGQASVCGAPACVPRTCQDLNATCGAVPDGCGNMLQCGSCTTAGESCGGGGVPNACGAPACRPLTCAGQGIGCGQAGDGCGGVLNCGTCSSGDSCGGGGVPSQCGRPSCTPQTCVSAGANCGPLGDGCGGVIASCGSCTGGNICGGGGVPSVCGGAGTGTSTTCTGLCQNQVYCPSGGATTLTGVVYAPNGTTPIHNAIVYVPVDPSAPLPTINTGAECDRCSAQDLGQPLVSTLSGADGRFTLRHVPASVSFPLVVKKGKWRRSVTITARSPCSTTALTAAGTRLPQTQAEGNIPHTAITTGRVDGLECVLRKAGVAASEFTRPTGNGRIHLYRGSIDRSSSGRGGAWPDDAAWRCQQCGTGGGATDQNCRTQWCGGAANSFRTNTLNAIDARRLYENQSVIDGYDMVIFGCEASEGTRDSADRGRVLQHVNVGGRLFLSHFHYDWIYKGGSYVTDPLNTTAVWGGGGGTGNLSDPTAAIIDATFPGGLAFSAWIDATNSAHPTLGSGFLEINEPRQFVQSTTALGRRWIYTTQADQNEDSVQQFTFNTPVGASAANICGRVAYSAFHVTIGSNWDTVFPAHCTGPLTAQEKALLFMLFDLASCVADENQEPPPPPSCTARTCAAAGAQCGVIADGCGSTVDCGTCPSNGVCSQNQCVPSSCVPRTCAQAGANCGVVADGCGGTRNCGSCPTNQLCGASAPNQCGVEPCVPRTCQTVGASCGPLADGCGAVVDCGSCTGGQVCGGGGTPNQCGAGTCTPSTCASAGVGCGWIGDGCGGAVDCGPCSPGQVCGAGGVPNQCRPACVPLTCVDVGAECGQIGDGCGAAVDCGPCTDPGQVCGAAGPNRCGSGCQPQTCASAGAQCGMIGDGCGAAIDCGPCPMGQACGTAGPNQCGPGTSCTPDTCASVGAQCGLIGDGCGLIVDCGTCPDGTTCGGGGVPNACGVSCTPRTCAQAGAECGELSDGCGNVVQCGACPTGLLCGAAGPNRCGGL
ncbi:MAG: hypothetical protein IT384_16245 [Deltaproteobacteria bacterium]|nr:hypothetical protein [Deltaproteobacteria bacterium]